MKLRPLPLSGAHLAADLGRARVRGLALLNATPFWGALPPAGAGRPSWLWDGRLPAPALLHAPCAAAFDALREPATTDALLSLVYANPREALAGGALARGIAASAAHPGGRAAFTSIALASAPARPFGATLRSRAARDVPLCLVYGREDPWVSPPYGQAVAGPRGWRPDAAYVELSPAGHCPHHEAPEATNAVLATFAAALDGAPRAADAPRAVAAALDAALGAERAALEPITGRTVVARRVDGRPRDLQERVARWFVPGPNDDAASETAGL